MMGNVVPRVELVRPPRWVYVRFPRGAMFGEPGTGTEQRRVLEETPGSRKGDPGARGKDRDALPLGG